MGVGTKQKQKTANLLQGIMFYFILMAYKASLNEGKIDILQSTKQVSLMNCVVREK
jgi:hypothetical protein